MSPHVPDLGALATLWDDPAVSDVLVNGPGAVWVERHGRLERTDLRLDRPTLDALCRRILHPLGVPLDRTHPVAESRFGPGARISVVAAPVAPRGPVLALRRSHRDDLGLDAFGPAEVVAALRDCLARRRNLVIAGATGAGKTALLAALCGECEAERLVVIEDDAELPVTGPRVVHLESRAHPAGPVEGMRHLVRAALRLRPDRLVVGEVRGAEALDMVWALSTGHRGSMSTVHAADAGAALDRLETLCLLGSEGVPAAAVRRQVRSAIEVVVTVARTHSAHRQVTGVWAVRPVRRTTELDPLVVLP